MVLVALVQFSFCFGFYVCCTYHSLLHTVLHSAVDQANNIFVGPLLTFYVRPKYPDVLSSWQHLKMLLLPASGIASCIICSFVFNTVHFLQDILFVIGSLCHRHHTTSVTFCSNTARISSCFLRFARTMVVSALSHGSRVSAFAFVCNLPCLRWICNS